jgi:hypothetical protein
MSDDSSLLWRLVATTPMLRAPTVAMDKVCISLLGHHSSDGTAMADRLPVAIENYRSLVQRRIILMYSTKYI